MKKLYRVEVIHSVYVMAKNEEEAESEALRGIQTYGDKPTTFAVEATRRSGVDPGWLDAPPFNSDDDRTVGDILGLKNKGTKRI